MNQNDNYINVTISNRGNQKILNIYDDHNKPSDILYNETSTSLYAYRKYPGYEYEIYLKYNKEENIIIKWNFSINNTY